MYDIVVVGSFVGANFSQLPTKVFLYTFVFAMLLPSPRHCSSLIFPHFFIHYLAPLSLSPFSPLFSLLFSLHLSLFLAPIPPLSLFPLSLSLPLPPLSLSPPSLPLLPLSLFPLLLSS